VDDYITKSTAILTMALTFVLVAEKAFQHERSVSSLWQDFKSRKAQYEARVMADAIVLCYGPQLDDAAIARSLDAFRREISEAEHRNYS